MLGLYPITNLFFLRPIAHFEPYASYLGASKCLYGYRTFKTLGVLGHIDHATRNSRSWDRIWYYITTLPQYLYGIFPVIFCQYMNNKYIFSCFRRFYRMIWHIVARSSFGIPFRNQNTCHHTFFHTDVKIQVILIVGATVLSYVYVLGHGIVQRVIFYICPISKSTIYLYRIWFSNIRFERIRIHMYYRFCGCTYSNPLYAD